MVASKSLLLLLTIAILSVSACSDVDLNACLAESRVAGGECAPVDGSDVNHDGRLSCDCWQKYVSCYKANDCLGGQQEYKTNQCKVAGCSDGQCNDSSILRIGWVALAIVIAVAAITG